MAKRNSILRLFCGLGRVGKFYFDSFHRAFLKAWLWALAISGAISFIVPTIVFLFGIKLTTDQEAVVNHLYIQIPVLFFLLLFVIMFAYVLFSKYRESENRATSVEAERDALLKHKADHLPEIIS
jgi:hypothetical protein